MENNKDYRGREKEDEIVDITSYSSKQPEFEDISSFSGKRNRYKKKPRGRFSKWWRKAALWKKISVVTSGALATILALVVGLVGYLYYYIGLDDLRQTEINESEISITEGLDDKIVNVALFGIDTRNTKSFKGNSDSIMILSLNTKTNQVKIISVMRDTFVPITYNGKTTYGKINSAYAKGGPKLAIKTLNSLFKLNITDYATVNFYGMMDIIDAVGGIDVTLTEGEVTKNINKMALNGCIKELCDTLGKKASNYYIYEAGDHHLNGIQAVAYSRIRKVANIWGTNNDYGRTDRQRYVMEQLFNRATTMSKTKYIELAKSLIPCSETSLTFSDIYDLAVDILLDSPTFSQARIPSQNFLMPSPSGYGSVVYFDIDFAGKLIHSFIYDDITFDDYIAQNGIEKNDWYRDRVGDCSTTSKPIIEVTSSEEEISSEDNSGSEGDSSGIESDISSGTESEDENSSNSSETESSSSSGSDDVSSEETVTSGVESEDDTSSGDTSSEETATRRKNM